MLERGYSQLSFLAEPVVHPHEFGFRIGDPSSAVFEKLASLYPDIAGFSYVVFDPNFSSSDSGLESSQDLQWIPKEDMTPEFLAKLSAKVADEMTMRVFTGGLDNEILECTGAIAIASLVEMADGTEKHLLLLDFECPISGENESTIRDMVKPHKGVLIYSGRSYHFIGADIMTPDQWRATIEESRRKESERSWDEQEIFDHVHLDLSLEKGFSALRIFGYADTEKPEEPRVISFVE